MPPCRREHDRKLVQVKCSMLNQLGTTPATATPESELPTI